jgi:hypothetical protein
MWKSVILMGKMKSQNVRVRVAGTHKRNTFNNVARAPLSFESSSADPRKNMDSFVEL